jgi:hypothetical protein
MDQDTIQKIAAEVAKHLPSFPWALLVVQTVLMVFAAALGAFFSEYFKTRGKHLATKADFDGMLSQVRANTEVIETIKAEVSQKDWAKREWTNLRRIKLEELLDRMHECAEHTEHRRSRAIEGKVWEGFDPQPKLDTLGALYFPELERQITNFSLAYRDQLTTVGTLGLAVLRSDDSVREAAFADFRASFQPSLSRMIVAADELKDAARKLLIEIVGIED